MSSKVLLSFTYDEEAGDIYRVKVTNVRGKESYAFFSGDNAEAQACLWRDILESLISNPPEQTFSSEFIEKQRSNG